MKSGSNSGLTPKSASEEVVAGKKCGLGPSKNSLWLRSEREAKFVRGQLCRLALVSVVKSSDLRNHRDAPVLWFLHDSRLWGVVGQG